MISSWKQIKAVTKINGNPMLYTRIDCEEAARSIGITTLPNSYIDYVATFGIGQWTPDFTIASPKHKYPALTLKYRAESSIEALAEVLKECPDFAKDPEVLKRLICIGGSGNGYELCWDSGRKSSNGEMSLCIVSHEDSDIYYCGNDLLEFIGNYWIGGKIETACPLAGTSWGPKAEFTVLDES